MKPDPVFSLTGKAALITGGSSGIGLSIAESFTEAGAALVILGRNAAKLERASKKLSAIAGGKVHSISADISDTSLHAHVVQETIQAAGRLDILVNAAGTHFKKPSLEVSEAEYDHLMAINLRAMFFFCQKVGAHMKDHGGGKIINIASLGSSRSFHEVVPYCMSKAGVEMLTKSLACEWARYNIAVNAIVPGFFRTPLNAKALDIPERMEAILSRTPAGRIGQLDELQGAAVFLASSASDYVRGHSLAVDGGFLALGV